MDDRLDGIEQRVEALCLALPEVTVREGGSWGRTYDIRRRAFCLLIAPEDPTGSPVPLLVLRADPDERDVLLAIGHPYFPVRSGRDRVGVLLTDHTDWDEVRELITESYRVLAPQKLRALLD